MAVKNSLVQKEENKPKTVTFEVNGMNVTLSPQIVRDYLVSGDKERVTFQELAMFINLCKYSKLNPWAKEAYCIKYGNEPATMVVSKEAFQKRAEANPHYDGAKAGVIVFIEETGELEYRNGTFTLEGEKVVGGWADVYRKDRTQSTHIEVSFDEYAGRKKDGMLNAQWSKKPATMIRKVALVQALREAFPSMLGGMYTAEEQGEDETSFITPIEQPEAVTTVVTEVVAENATTTDTAAKPTEKTGNVTNVSNVSAALFNA